MSKIIAPAAINALKEALTYIYWYKNDQRAFLIQALGITPFLVRLTGQDINVILLQT